MPIHYYLQHNAMRPNATEQFAQIAASETLTTDDLIKKAILRGTTLTETDVRAVMNLMFTVMAEEVAEGNNISTPLVNIRPGISGTFSKTTDTFDSAKHTKAASLTSGTLLTQKMRGAKVEKISFGPTLPTLLEFVDCSTGNINKLFTAGGIGQIVGSELKFNPANAGEGIFVVNREVDIAFKITVLAIRTKGKLVFELPEQLPTGHYNLEVRKGYGNAATIRKGVLENTLQPI